MADFTKLNGYTVKDPNAIHTYDTITDLKADTKLKSGMHVSTKGYNNVNDGGNEFYVITSTHSSSEWQETLNNGLYANLLHNGVLHINQLGADNTGQNDSSVLINSVLSFINSRWVQGKFDIDTLVFNGEYLIESQIELPPFCKLTGDGYVTFKTNVEVGESAFWIHYPNGVISDSFAGTKLQYQYANLLDFPQGCLFKNINGTKQSTAIELGEHSDVENKKNVSRFKICNFAVENYDIAIKYNSFDIYICNHERLHLEENNICVKFGDNGVNRVNAGEHMLFDNCLFASGHIGFLYETTGFSLDVVNSSIDFLDYVVTDPYALGWHKISISTTHIEGCRHLLGTIGVPNLININNNVLITKVKSNEDCQLITMDDNLSNKTKSDLSTGVCNISNCYLVVDMDATFDPSKIVYDSYMNVLLENNKCQDFNVRLFTTNGNILNRSLDDAETGDISLAQNVKFGKNNIFKVVRFAGFNSTATIVQDDYIYTGHKSLQLTRGTGDTTAINIETALLPVKKSIYYSSVYTFNKKSGNSIRYYWYDKDGNEISQSDAYVYTPTVGSANEWFMNHNCKYGIAPPDAAYFKVIFYLGNWQGNSDDQEDTIYKIGGIMIN